MSLLASQSTLDLVLVRVYSLRVGSESFNCKTLHYIIMLQKLRLLYVPIQQPFIPKSYWLHNTLLVFNMSEFGVINVTWSQ